MQRQEFVPSSVNVSAHGSPQAFATSRYMLQERIGQGGMGSVYRALDRLTGETVALKLLSPTHGDLIFNSRADYADLDMALANEFAILASLRHPNIISVLDYGFDSGEGTVSPFFTMTLLHNAATITAAARGKPAQHRAALLIGVLQALAYLHRRGILHRDLKPSNILVPQSPEPMAKVLDFGIALDYASDPAAQSGDGTQANGTHALGTLAYTAPEILNRSRPFSRASDMYAIGIIAYELFAGRHPYNTSNRAHLMQDILRGGANLDAITPPLRDVVARLLDNDPDQRYDNANSVIRAVCESLALELPAETVPLRESYLQAAPFIGRDEEIATLSGLLERTSSGTGGLCLVGGESGVGKSRLIREVRIRALVNGVLVPQGQAIADAALPNQLWRDVLPSLLLHTPITDFEARVLKSIVPNIGGILGMDVPDAPPTDTASAQRRLALTIRDVFARQTQPIMLILEDLQWARDGLEVLQFVTPLVESHRLLIVGTFRSDEAPQLPGQFPQAEVLHLQRLSHASVVVLGYAMLGEFGRRDDVIGLLTRETEGNTFFIVEMVRALAEQAGTLAAVGSMALPQTIIPGGVRELLQRRLSRVPEWARTALKLAAIAGRQIDAQIMTAIQFSPDWERWLIACAEASVLEVSDGNWRFSHDKLREYLLSSLADDEAHTLYGTVALAFEQVHGSDEFYAPKIADLWRGANNVERELPFRLTAIDVGIRYGDSAENMLAQAEYILAALDHVSLPDADHIRGVALRTRAETRTTLAHKPYEDMLADIHQALRIFEARGDNAQIGTTYERLGWVYEQNAPEHALDAYTNAVVYMRKAPQPNDLDEALFVVAGWHIVSVGSFRQALKYSEESLIAAQHSRARQYLLCRLYYAFIHEGLGLYKQARALYQENVEIARASNDLPNTGRLFCDYYAPFLSGEGEHDLARAFIEEGEAMIMRLPEYENRRPLFRWQRATMEASSGDLDAAEAIMRDSLDPKRRQTMRVDSRLVFGEILCAQGNYIEAEENLEWSCGRWPQAMHLCIRAVRNASSAAYLHMLTGNMDRAKVLVQTALERSSRIDALPTIAQTLVTAAWWEYLCGRHDSAARLFATVESSDLIRFWFYRLQMTQLRDALREKLPPIESAPRPADVERALQNAVASLLENLS
jgi:eukaryotic-like serine/threonine-protein kinase